MGRRMTSQIPLVNRRGTITGWTLVDTEDCGWLSEHKWHLSQNGYAVRGTRRGGRRAQSFLLKMHREILGLMPGDPRESDHVNGDRLDNRRANLRAVTKSENQQNVVGARRGAISKFRGVSWHAKNKNWRVEVQVNKVRHGLGSFASEEEAGRVAAEFRATHMPCSPEARS